MKFVIVGFSVAKENSVFYSKCDTIEQLMKKIDNNKDKCDFMSLRIIKDDLNGGKK